MGYKKHFVIVNNNGSLGATKPKDWARANQGLFTDFDFKEKNTTPTVAFIEKYLTELGFTKIEDQQVIIFYPYDQI